jgi:tetratricopeptide (TPR) repeat protein
MLAWAELAVVLAKRLGDPAALSTALTHHGNACRIAGDFDEARKSFAEAEQAGGASALLFEFRASLAENTGELSEALHRLSEASKIRRAAGDQEGLARNLVLAAKVSDQEGQSQRAVDLLTEALDFIPSGEEFLFRTAAQNLIHCVARAGFPERALRYYGQMEPVLRNGGRRMVAHLDWLLGRIASEIRDDAGAVRFFEGARDSFGGLGMEREGALVALDLAYQHASVGRSEAALGEASRTEPVLTRLGVASDAKSARLLIDRNLWVSS